MGRRGLIVALSMSALVGIIFAVYPELDLRISALFFDPESRRFILAGSSALVFFREAAMWVVASLVAPAVVALVAKLAFPRRRLLLSGRAMVFLIATIALAPGLVANAAKENWSRARPINTTEFNGGELFTAWWDPRGVCSRNCSLVAGEASGAFWTLAPAALSPPAWRPLAYGAAIAFGAGVGLLRVAFGAHFFSDIVFSGISTFLVIWIVHGLIYRWRRTAFSDHAVERAIERIVLRRMQPPLQASTAVRAEPPLRDRAFRL